MHGGGLQSLAMVYSSNLLIHDFQLSFTNLTGQSCLPTIITHNLSVLFDMALTIGLAIRQTNRHTWSNLQQIFLTDCTLCPETFIKKKKKKLSLQQRDTFRENQPDVPGHRQALRG